MRISRCIGLLIAYRSAPKTKSRHLQVALKRSKSSSLSSVSRRVDGAGSVKVMLINCWDQCTTFVYGAQLGVMLRGKTGLSGDIRADFAVGLCREVEVPAKPGWRFVLGFFLSSVAPCQLGRKVTACLYEMNRTLSPIYIMPRSQQR